MHPSGERTWRVAVAEMLCLTAVTLAVVFLGVLRSFNEQTPEILPGPFGSLLFAVLAVLVVAQLAERRGGADLYDTPSGRARVTLARSLPILVAVVGEKWVSVELLERAYDWTDEYIVDPALTDASYRLWSGLALLAIGLASVGLLRQVRARIARRAALSGIVPGILLFGAALAVTALLVLGIGRLVGPLRFGVRDLSYGPLFAAIAAQIVRGVAEELYYRGLVQTAFGRLLEAAGVPAGRPAQALAIFAVSAGFTLEHFRAEGTMSDMLRSSLWIFAMSCVLGAMLELSRNLWLVMLTHASINILLALLVPIPVAENLVPIVPPEVGVLWLIVMIFCGIALAYRMRSVPEE